MKVVSRVVRVAMFLTIGFNLSAQKVIKITEDTVFDETMEFNEDTILEGEGNPKVTFNGEPKFKINNCRVMIKNMRVTDKGNWGKIYGNGGTLEWTGIGMHGILQDGEDEFVYMLDGVTKRD